MPRAKHTTARSRLNLVMDEQVRRNLEDLRESTGADTLAEVIRRAVAVYELLLSQVGKGSTILIDEGNGAPPARLVLPEVRRAEPSDSR